MTTASRDFPLRPGPKVRLTERPTLAKPFCNERRQCQERPEDHVEDLTKLQRPHYASGRYALLLPLQGMDDAGKDGAIRHATSIRSLIQTRS